MDQKTYYQNRLIGRRFGQLLVTGFAGYAKGHKTIWLCKCDCGNEKIVRNDCLVKGTTKSCGCLLKLVGAKHKSWKGHGEISLSHWNKIIREAELRNLQVSITIEDAWKLFLKQSRKCALSGKEIDFGKFKDDPNRTASLDRIDSSLGYAKGNVQWVSKEINIAKQTMSQDEFIEMCRTVAKFNSRS